MEKVALPGGVTLAYDVFDFTDPWRKPEPLVFVHGFSKNRKFWYEWLPHFARDYRVYNIDQRGHGDSSPVAADSAFSLSPFARDLVDFLDAQGIDSAHFVMAEFASAVAARLRLQLAGRRGEPEGLVGDVAEGGHRGLGAGNQQIPSAG